jgi:hypothetical protein
MTSRWDLLLPPSQGAQDSSWWCWATVAAVSPVRIRLDGEADALGVDVETLVSGLADGARVWVQFYGRRVIVHGVAH